MDDNQTLRQRREWQALLAAHRTLVSAYLQALGTETAFLIAPQVRAITVQVGALSELLDLPLEGEQR